jgi:Flp pilus assembly pilin Flp
MTTNLYHDESGQALTEYALILGVVVTVALLASLGVLSGAVGSMLDAAAAAFS